jgi:uncharacterized protein YbaR (Trm112 family)
MENIEYMEQLFRQTREINSEWFEADNLDKIRLIYEEGKVVVENNHGTTFELGYLSTQEIDIISDNLESTDQYVIEELFYVKEKQTYDEGSLNGLINIRLYYIEDDVPVMFYSEFEIESDSNIEESIYEFMEEKGFYIYDLNLKEL